VNGGWIYWTTSLGGLFAAPTPALPHGRRRQFCCGRDLRIYIHLSAGSVCILVLWFGSDDEGVDGVGRGDEQRAKAEDLYESGVVVPEAVGEGFASFGGHG